MEAENPGITQLARQVNQYARMAFYGLSFGRMVLLLVSLKNLRVTKLYFYYDALFFVAE